MFVVPKMRLPQAPTLYDPRDQAEVRRIIEGGLLALNAPLAELPSGVGMYNVVDMGADETGVNDAHGILMDAYNKCKSRGGGTIIIPPGALLLASDMWGAQDYTTWTDNTRIWAYGATLMSQIAYGTTRQALRLLGNNLLVEGLAIRYTEPFDVDDPHYHNAIVDGEAIRIGGGFGLANAKSFVTVRNVSVVGAANAGILPWNCEHAYIHNNYVTEVLGTGIYPGEMVRNVNVYFNVVHHCGDDPIFVEKGGGPSAPLTVGVRILDNFIFDSTTRGFGFAGCTDVVGARNTIDGTWVAGIQPEWTGSHPNGAANIILRDNIIKNAGTNFGVGKKQTVASPVPHGIYWTAGGMVKGLEIAGNKIKDARNYGMLLSFMDGLRVHHNEIDGTGQVGISVGATGASDRKSITNSRVESNTMQNIGSIGVFCTHATDTLISDNQIYKYGIGGGTANFPVWIDNCERTRETGSTIVNNGTPAADQLNPVITGTSPECWTGFGTMPIDPAVPVGTSVVAQTLGAAGQPRHFYGSAPPTDGYHNVGDIFWNTLCSSVGRVLYWHCVLGGNPGTCRVGAIFRGSSSDWNDTDGSFTPGSSPDHNYYEAALSANRTFRLNYSGFNVLWDGFEVELKVYATALGAFTITVTSDAATILTISAAGTYRFRIINGKGWVPV